jgi:galactokinase
MAYQRIPLPPSADLVVLSSGISHSNASGAYNTRRAECEHAAEQLGVARLRDVAVSDLPRVDQLPEPLNRRARHVVTEDQRVLDAVDALRRRDLERLGALLSASHQSLRDDFAVSLPEIDLVVDLARTEPGILGARLTGGGFGGSVVMLAEAGQGRISGERIAAEYAARTGRTPRLLLPPAPP